MVFALVLVIPVRSRDPFSCYDPPSRVHALCTEILKVERCDL